MGRQRNFADCPERGSRREGRVAGVERYALRVRWRRWENAVYYDGVDGGGVGRVGGVSVCDAGSVAGRTDWEVSSFAGMGGAAASSVGKRWFGSNADLMRVASTRSDASDSLKMARYAALC